MKNFKKLNLFLSSIAIFSVVLGSFSLPVLAQGKDDADVLRQQSPVKDFVKVKTSSDNDEAILVFSPKVKVSVDSPTVQEEEEIPIPPSFKKVKDSADSLKVKKEKIESEESPKIETEEKDYVKDEILVKYKNSKINLNTASGRTVALDFIQTKSLEKKEIGRAHV